MALTTGELTRLRYELGYNVLGVQAEPYVTYFASLDRVVKVPILHYDGTPITARFIAKTIGDHLDALKVTPLRKVVS